MPITLVQDVQAAAGGTTTVTPTLGVGATAGNLLVAAAAYRADRTLSMPAAFNLAVDGQNSSADTTHQDCAIWYTIAAGGETGIVFTISATGNVSGWVGEYAATAGSAWVTPLDQTGAKTEASASVVLLSSSVTTTVADEVVVCSYAWNDSGLGLPTGRSYSNSFTEQGFANNGTNNAIAGVHRILTSTTTTSTNAAWTNGSNVICVIASFKGDVVGATVDPYPYVDGGYYPTQG